MAQPRRIQFEGQIHEFPADATDEEIAAALDSLPKESPALAAARNPDDIGGSPSDHRKMTDAQLLQTLQAQIGDPNRDPGSAAELQAEIARLQKRISATPAPAPVPAASQADVRRSEPALSPGQTEDARIEAWNKATDAFMRQGLNARPPAGMDLNRWATMTEPERIEWWSGVARPSAEREDKAMIEELRAGGDVRYGDSVPYVAAQALAGMGGFAAYGPTGATAAQGLVRLAALTSNLDKAVEAGAIDWHRAVELIAKELVKGAAWDSLFNFGVPAGAQMLGGIKDWLLKKFGVKAVQTLEQELQRQRALQQRADLAPTPAGKQAVAELGKRTEDVIPTPGQVTGDAGNWEALSRRGTPYVHSQAQEKLQGAAQSLRDESLNPPGYIGRKGIGEAIADTADRTEQAVKNRLRPVFDEADNLNVQVDFSGVLARAKAALADDASVPGGKLKPNERETLKSIVSDLEQLAQPAKQVPSTVLGPNGQPAAVTNVAAVPPRVGARQALDFMSRQKEVLRDTVKDGVPSREFSGVEGELNKIADSAYDNAAQKIGRPDVKSRLDAAREEYRTLMDTVYKGAVRDALRKDPEEVGRRFWQRGNVTEVEQLGKLLQRAQREGQMTAEGAQDLMGQVTRGFLQDAAPNLNAVANWSRRLNESQELRDTWNALTAQPGGKALRGTMEILEQAAQIAGRDSSELLKGRTIPLYVQRGAQGSIGVSSGGTIHPGILATSLSLTGLTHAAATAYTSGATGIGNGIMRVLRANSALMGVKNKLGGTAYTATGLAVLRDELPKIEKFANDHGFSIYGDQEDQQ